MESKNHDGHVIIIFNSIRPYAFEVNNILALPNGFFYRFRFRQKWMPTIKSPSDLVGRKGLIVFRDFNKAIFIPLRRIQVSNILEVGEVSYIVYCLGDIIDFDSDETIRQGQLEEFNERMAPAIRGFENKPGNNLEKLIFIFPDLAYGLENKNYKGSKEEQPLNSWGNLIQILSDIDCFEDFDFLKVVDVVDNNGYPVKILPGRNGKDTARYSLESNRIYRVQIFQRTFTRREADSSVIHSRQMVIKGEPEVVNMIQFTNSITGKYDLYLFPFKVESKRRIVDSSLNLQIQRQDEVNPPNIDIPIRINVSIVQTVVWGLSLLCFIAGIFLLFGGDQLGLPLNTAKLLERIGIMMAVLGSYGLGPITKSLLERFGISYSI